MALVVDNKRKPDDTESAIVAKKPRNDALQELPPGVSRTSSLLAPTMLLSGHKGEIFTLKFSPSGNTLASGSFDKDILLWNVHDECKNFIVLRGHGGAVLELHWTIGGDQIVSCSVDKTVHVWDAETGKRLKRLREHSQFVNSVCPARRGCQLISGSDDATARIWDTRMRGSIKTLQTTKVPVTSVAFGDSTDQVYTGGLDNDIRVWDLRKGEVLFSLRGHTDTITGLRLSPDGSYLLSNAMDNSVRIWDIRPYVPFQRCVKIFQGVQHNFEKNLLKCSWSPDGSKVSAGSADRFVYVWDTTTRNLLYKLPGHHGSVNEVDFHPTEPIIASGSSDKNIFLGELSV
jgi:Prp8 binding protein